MDERPRCPVRGQPAEPAVSGLPHARIPHRGRGRGARDLDPPEPFGPRQHRQPRRVADHGLSRVCLGVLRSRRTRPEEPHRRARRTRARESAGPGRRGHPRRHDGPGAAPGARDAQPHRSGSPSCCTTCSRCLSKTSRRSSTALLPRPASSPAGLGGESRAATKRTPGDLRPPAGDRRSVPGRIPPWGLRSARHSARPRRCSAGRSRRGESRNRQPRRGAPLLAPEVRGGRAVANALVGRAQAAQAALIEGSPGAVWAPAGGPGPYSPSA